METKRNVISVILAAAILLLAAVPAQPATEDEIEAAIVKGLEWLAAQQNLVDGSWSSPTYAGDEVALTAFAVLKMEDRGYELAKIDTEIDDPFDPDYIYSQNVIDGLDYIFSQALARPAGGIYFRPGNHETYNTAVAMMAIAGSRTPAKIVATGLYAGQTYKHVLQGNVTFLEKTQNADGGWRYQLPHWPDSDNSNTGFAALGLRYAEADLYGFKCPILAAVKVGLGGGGGWIDYIQNDPGIADDGWESDPDGGSGYTHPNSWVNTLKTGNLLFEMAFVTDDTSVQRVIDAIGYIERHWDDADRDPGWKGPAAGLPHYQAMYCLMKGFESLSIETITVGASDVDWYAEFADAIVDTQILPGGFWPWLGWLEGDELLNTEFALLTLQRVAPPPVEIPVFVDIKPQSCPNPLNKSSKGVLPVAVLGTEDLDVTLIDPTTVGLSREGVVDGQGDPVVVSPLRWDYEDVATPFEGELCDCHEAGPDGYMDLTLKFDTQELVEKLELCKLPDWTTIPLTLTGNLVDEESGEPSTPIRGADCVRIQDKKGPKK